MISLQGANVSAPRSASTDARSPVSLYVLLGFLAAPRIWLAACRIRIVGQDKRFTGDDLLDVEMTRDIARLRRERRDAEQSQSAKRRQHSDDLSRKPSKAAPKKS